MLKKILIAAAIVASSFVVNTGAEAATMEVTAQYTGSGTFEAIQGAKRKALQQVPTRTWARIIKYTEMSFPDRFTCRIKCIIKYDE